VTKAPQILNRNDPVNDDGINDTVVIGNDNDVQQGIPSSPFLPKNTMELRMYGPTIDSCEKAMLTYEMGK
jgi:hypothetical protein